LVQKRGTHDHFVGVKETPKRCRLLAEQDARQRRHSVRRR